jgi:poly(A) polymerase
LSFGRLHKPNSEILEESRARYRATNAFLESRYTLEVFFKPAIIIEPGFSRIGNELRAASRQTILERPLKAVQLACQHSLKLEKQIQSWLLEVSSGAAVLEDFATIVKSNHAVRGIELMSETGLLEKFLPELEACRGVEQFGGFHHLDVLNHSIEALARLVSTFPESSLEIRLATLFHDIGKPAAKTWDVVRERWSFFAHDQIGTKVTRALLTRIGFDETIVERVSSMVDSHMIRLPADQASAARFVRRNQKILPELLQVMIADREAARGPASSEPARLAYQHQIDMVLEAMTKSSSLEILMNGDEIMEYLNLKPGKAVGQALEFLRILQENGEITNLEQAKTALHEWAKIQAMPH